MNADARPGSYGQGRCDRANSTDGDKTNLDQIAQTFPGAPVLAKPMTRDGLHKAILAARNTYIS